MPGANSFPEGTNPLVMDNERRLLVKWNQLLYNSHGNVGHAPFPEGVQPLAMDDEHRSEVKINAIYQAIA